MIGKYHSLLRGVDYLISNGVLSVGRHNAFVTGTYILVKDFDLASYIRQNFRGNVDVNVTSTRLPQRVYEAVSKRNASIVMLDSGLEDMEATVRYLNEKGVKTVLF